MKHTPAQLSILAALAFGKLESVAFAEVVAVVRRRGIDLRVAHDRTSTCTLIDLAVHHLNILSLPIWMILSI